MRATLYRSLNDKEMARTNYQLILKLRPDDGEALSQVGFLSWQMNDFEAAANAFATHAVDDVDSWLWLQLANVRLGRALSDYHDGLSSRYWPAHLVRFYRGALSETDLLTAADDAQMGRLPGKIKYAHALCNAHLFAGLWRVVHGDQAGATPLLKTAVEKCDGLVAENLAKGELAKMATGEKAP